MLETTKKLMDFEFHPPSKLGGDVALHYPVAAARVAVCVEAFPPLKDAVGATNLYQTGRL
jgi:hypothetical protein